MRIIGIVYTTEKIEDIETNTTYAGMCDAKTRRKCEKDKKCMKLTQDTEWGFPYAVEEFKKCRALRFMVEEVEGEGVKKQ